MLKKLFALFAFAFAVNLAYAQDGPCHWEFVPHCVARLAFSIENIHQIRFRAAQEALYVLEATWHESEPIFVGLAKWPDQTIKRLVYWLFDDYASGAETISQVNLAKGENFAQLAVTRDAIIVGTDTGSILHWDLAKGEFLFELTVSDDPITEILLHPSKSWLAVVSDRSELFQVDLELKAAAKIYLEGSNPQALEALAFSNDGHLFAAAGQGAIRTWNAVSWDAWEAQPVSASSIGKLLFTEENSQLIVLADTSVSRWSLDDGRIDFVQVFDPHPDKRPCHLTDGDISLDESLLMTTDDCDQQRAWDMEMNREVIPLAWESFTAQGYLGTVMEFSPDGRYLISARSDLGILGIDFVPEAQ